MSSGNYKGDSPGKKITRTKLWISCANFMNSLGIPYQGSLVLGGEGGDVSTLVGLGFDPSQISVVDKKQEYAEFCEELYPGTTVVHAEVGKASPYLKYNAVHLDFCGGLSVDNIESIVEVARNVATLPAFLGVTMIKGREHLGKNKFSIVPPLPRPLRKKLKQEAINRGDEAGARMYVHGKFAVKELYALCEKRMRKIWSEDKVGDDQTFFRGKNRTLTAVGRAMVRADVIRQCADAVLLPQQIQLLAVNILAYHSKDKGHPGIPFFTVGYLVVHESQMLSIVKWCEENGTNLLSYKSMTAKDGMSALRPTALSLIGTYSLEEVAMIFDIPKRTLAAWKAHASRGTYGDDETSALKVNGHPATASSLGWGKTVSAQLPLHPTQPVMGRNGATPEIVSVPISAPPQERPRRFGPRHAPSQTGIYRPKSRRPVTADPVTEVTEVEEEAAPLYPDPLIVKRGSKVRFQNCDTGRERTVTLWSPQAAQSGEEKLLRLHVPLAIALLDAEVGEMVQMELHRKTVDLEILEISNEEV